MNSRQKAAKAALDYNKSLKSVFVTSDNIPFARENDAKNHEKSLESDGKVIEVTRSEIESLKEPSAPASTEGGEGGDSTASKPAKAADLIASIESAETVEAVDKILGEDSRVTVVAAANKRKEELTAGSETSSDTDATTTDEGAEGASSAEGADAVEE